MLSGTKKRQTFEKEALPHLDALYAMALRLTRDPADAEDLVQDTMVKSYRFYHRYREGTNIRAWLFKVLVNLFYNDRRKAKKDQRIQLEVASQELDGQLLSEGSRSDANPEAELLDHISEQYLREALEKLPEEFRLPVLLCDVHDFSYREIAEIMGCPVGTVMSRLYRGRQQLRRRLYSYALEQGYIRPAPRAADPPADLAAYRRNREKK